MAEGTREKAHAPHAHKPDAAQASRAQRPDPFTALQDRAGNRALGQWVSARSEPLPSPVRARVESFTGADLAAARVHTGTEAEGLTASAGARALTYGEDIYLGAGERTGDTRLLAHEAAHVVQQTAHTSPGAGSGARALAAKKITPDSDPSEREAEAMEEAVLGSAEPPALTLSGGEHRIARQPINTTPTPPLFPPLEPPASIDPTDVQRDYERNPIAEANGHWYPINEPYYSEDSPHAPGVNFHLWPINPNSAFRALHARCEEIRDEQRAYSDDLLSRGDMKGWFARVYSYVTTRELEAVDAGRYQYPHMKMQEVIAFHAIYKQNLDNYLAGRTSDVEAHWREAFEKADYHTGGDWWLPYSTEVLYSLLPAMQAHIRFDLPRAIAAVYVAHYAGIPGTSLQDFHADFEAMAPVFEQATDDVRSDIQDEASAFDPGTIGPLQDVVFPFIFSIPIERDITWEKAGAISEAMQDPTATDASLESSMRSSAGTAHPNTGPETFEIRGDDITGTNWLHPPVNIPPEPPGPAMEYEPAPPPPAFPEYLYFKFDRPRADDNLEDAIRDDQDLAPYRDLALWTRQVRDADMQIVGHASSEGPDWYNENLGGARADLLDYFMWRCGADFVNNKMMTISFGETFAGPVPEDRYAHITIWSVGTSRQLRHPPNESLPSEVNTPEMRRRWLYPA